MPREQYGIDAPTVVRNLALGGAACLAGWVAATYLHVRPLAPFRPAFLGAGLGMSLGAGWMLVSSLWLKHRVCHALLAGHAWTGYERALDVGCGRGLVLVNMALRLTQGGTATGVDLWQSVDLSGNDLAHTLANARAAGVAERVSVDTGDMRSLPYEDAAFDVVASMTAIHNVPDAAGRAQAIAEIWRVTKPGGAILLFDIRHALAYARQLRELGADVRTSGPIVLWGPLGWRLQARKPMA